MITQYSINRMLIALVVFIFAVPCIGLSSVVLIDEGGAKCIIVLPVVVDEAQSLAADELRKTLEYSTGVRITVVSEDKLEIISKYKTRIIFGPSELTDRLTGGASTLKEEEFRIKTINNDVVILAKDILRSNKQSSSFTSLWAVSYILDRYLGVRWLWPGKLGTVIPKVSKLVLPSIDIYYQPKLVSRKIRTKRNNELLTRWIHHHQGGGRRVKYKFGHAFHGSSNNGDWWEKYHLTRPELLAEDPQGKRTYRKKPKFVKLCLSNPDVTEEILEIWRGRGKPDFWNVSPNDGGGFCTCVNCRAIDAKYSSKSYTKNQIWKNSSDINLSGRYVWFWNQLIRKMRSENENVTIGTYFYSAYRDPPQKNTIEDGILGNYVGSYEFNSWAGWFEKGANQMGLRPNWLYIGASAPHLPLIQVGTFLKKAKESGMIFVDMDSLVEYWGTQGPLYYLIGRSISRPDLDIAQILDEYSSTFGDAAVDINKYLSYWEEYHKKVAYNIPAGGPLSVDKFGIYETICRTKYGKVLSPLQGHWRTLPFIYPEDVMKRAFDILASASGRVKNPEILSRIEFLRDGLVQLQITIEIMESTEEKKPYKIRDLRIFCQKMRKKYGFWGASGIDVLESMGIIE